MRFVALPTWIMANMVTGMSSHKFVWQYHCFSLQEWYDSQTDLGRAVDWFFWQSVPMSVGLLIWLIIK